MLIGNFLIILFVKGKASFWQSTIATLDHTVSIIQVWGHNWSIDHIVVGSSQTLFQPFTRCGLEAWEKKELKQYGILLSSLQSG